MKNNKVLKSIAKNFTSKRRRNLSGLHFETDYVVATDACKLIKYPLKSEKPFDVFRDCLISDIFKDKELEEIHADGEFAPVFPSNYNDFIEKTDDMRRVRLDVNLLKQIVDTMAVIAKEDGTYSDMYKGEITIYVGKGNQQIQIHHINKKGKVTKALLMPIYSE